MDDADFNRGFWTWMENSVGVPTRLVASLDADDDWTFVIKIFGILEAGINHLLTLKIANPEAAKVICLMETSNDRRGKVALLKAFGLLSDEQCLFVKLLSRLRSHAVHNVRHFDLNLVEHLKGDKQNTEGWKVALTSWCKPPIHPSISKAAFEHPRKAIHNACMAIMIRCLKNQHEAEQGERFLAQFHEHAESIPKE